MHLNLQQLHAPEWAQKGYDLPKFDVERVRAAAPRWVHFGAGNIFRSFIACAQQTVLDKGLCDHGIVVCEGFDPEIVERAYRPFDNLSVAVSLKANGGIDKRLVASVVESLTFADMARLQEIFASPALQMASFTITEKGYDPKFAHAPGSLMGTLADLLRHRMRTSAAPIALVSMDNCSRNGEKLQNVIEMLAEGDAEFAAYLREKVTFPWTMIDKITPRPDPRVAEMLRQDGFEDTELIITARKTYTAAFVNAEEKEYLVIEDNFPNGRPPLEAAGIYFAGRETVSNVERMKVTTCLNPLHTALAVFGCVMGYETICAEMGDPLLKKLVERIGYVEGLPVVVSPGIIDPKTFIDEVVNERLPNVFLPDTPQRIATDTSQKLAIRFGETIKAHVARGDVDALVGIPLALAGWFKYLSGVGDDGAPFALSPDPRLPLFAEPLTAENAGRLIPPVLRDTSIFGLDLEEAGLANRVLAYAQDMLAGTARAVLERELKD
ncbi:MAG TPA: mannitol dehydrogenase family protein [Candidatus Ornithocaccomicrobium faecavium]|uniref:Mannitol dehydrogenase family protein n=1 Tax=Candidatus Ornithocaccomicrobium faecavium TaxID=2840890 RepID=A0A9D1PAR0_9FIRM|nr:mannitol dehydrogenase family protein [Clostridiales bacterium]HIV28808.1 mannitol dehydrogenase family protein [Candidatus Ornithocaccomicrobium faecavium]